MTNLSIVSQKEVSKNQVIRSRVAKTQQPGAERLIYNIFSEIIKRRSKNKVLLCFLENELGT